VSLGTRQGENAGVDLRVRGESSDWGHLCLPGPVETWNVSPARLCSPEGDSEWLFAFLCDAALCPLSQIEQGCSGVGSTIWLDAVLERPPGALILQVATRKHNFSDLVERPCNSPH